MVHQDRLGDHLLDVKTSQAEVETLGASGQHYGIVKPDVGRGTVLLRYAYDVSILRIQREGTCAESCS